MIKIAIDAMGNDLGVQEVVKACKEVISGNQDIFLKVVGNKTELEELSSYKNIEIIASTDVISMDDGALAIRRKKNSSMVLALQELASKNVEAIVSCGSTGALASGAYLMLEKLNGVERPCLVGTFPAKNNKKVLVLDIGANSENTSDHLVSFAKIANVYVKEVFGIKSPKIALLNIGSEEGKGNSLTKETFSLLKEEQLNFVGNIEARYILNGEVDVVVTDGFSGNLVLKSLEGGVSFIMNSFKDVFYGSLKNKLAALVLKKDLNNLKNSFDYKQIGGALLFGLNGYVIKAHGSSDATAIKNAILLAKKMVNNKIIEKIMEASDNNEEIA